jgi:hypothetical protein
MLVADREAKMLSFGVSNLRRLKLVPPVELKPITILVGRNSSGKSTFLRTFPLLRQSLMTRTSSPVLWYGDLVDFGSFDTSVTDNASSEPISFSFVMDELSVEGPRSRYRRQSQEPPTYKGVHFDVSISGSGDRTRISRLFIRCTSPKVSYEIIVGEGSTVASIRLNGVDKLELVRPLKLRITPGTLLPELSVVPVEGKKPSETLQQSYYYYYPGPSEFIESIKQLLAPYLKRLSADWQNRFAAELLILGPSNKKVFKDQLGSMGPKSWRVFAAEISSSDRREIFPKLQDLLSIAALPYILASIRTHLRSIITSTLYIGPARARSERYYRYQDLAVSEIDPDGKNFPMFLNSLSHTQIAQLSRWIEGLFGYGLSVSRQSGGGHMSIDLVAKGVNSNIVDNGYGVSQILPVLGQIWWARNRSASGSFGPAAPAFLTQGPSLSLLAIEQPELHLHPAHQALLADALVGELNSNSSKVKETSNRIHFLVETHSETLLNRLGELIAMGRILHSDIQVILFEAIDEESRITDVRTSSFGELGELENWPYGFFQPSVK